VKLIRLLISRGNKTICNKVIGQVLVQGVFSDWMFVAIARLIIIVIYHLIELIGIALFLVRKRYVVAT